MVALTMFPADIVALAILPPVIVAFSILAAVIVALAMFVAVIVALPIFIPIIVAFAMLVPVMVAFAMLDPVMVEGAIWVPVIDPGAATAEMFIPLLSLNIVTFVPPKRFTLASSIILLRRTDVSLFEIQSVLESVNVYPLVMSFIIEQMTLVRFEAQP